MVFVFGLLFNSWMVMGQTQPTTPELRRQQMKEHLRYERSSKPETPSERYIDPPYYDRNASEIYVYEEELSETDIQRSRDKRFPNRSRNGIRQRMVKGQLPELEDLSTPEIEAPEIRPVEMDSPDIDGSFFSSDFWKFLLIIIAIVVIAAVAYVLSINGNEGPKRRLYNDLSDNADWDPTEIEVDELTKKLNEVLNRGDFRAGIRVYYTLILKELVDKGWIQWEKKKTNYHYLREMSSKKQQPQFERCVSLFEMVWYGNYHLNREQFAEVEPKFKQLYANLKHG
jgi:hypothetical protein